VRGVRWFADGRRVGVSRSGPVGIYTKQWVRGGAKKGPARLRAVVVDAKGRTAAAVRTVRVCS
jgi:hypothetical protein